MDQAAKDNIIYLQTSGSQFKTEAPEIHTEDGSKWVKIPPGGNGNPPEGGGDDPMKTPFEKLKQNVEWLNKILGAAILAAIGGFVGLFFILDDRIGDRFLTADQKISEVSKQVADLRVDTAKQDTKLDQILEKLNGSDTKESAGNEAGR